MRIIPGFLFTFFVWLPLQFHSQVVVDKQEHEFGEITRQTNRVVDFTFTNTGDEKAFILRSDFPREFNILFSDREVQPDSSITLRTKFNPLRKEKVDFTVPVFFSSMAEPIELEFSGEVLFIDPADNPACPSFNEQSAGAAGSSFETEFLVVDKNTGEPIRSASIRLIERGRVARTLKTDRQGRVFEEVPIKYYYVLAESENYHEADTSSWINRRNTFFKFELDPMEREQVEMTASENRPSTQIENEVERDEPKGITATEPGVEETPTPPDNSEYSEDHFAHNNLVFLIDVSSSMNRSGRLDMLKASMLELVEMLREVDRLTVLTYAANTEEVLPPTFVKDKNEIEELIRNMEAEGYTSGNKAVNRAYETAAENYIEGGNNQVILVTDGVFRSSDVRRIRKTVDVYVKQDISLSIIGLKSSEENATALSEYATMGNGSYIPINHFDEGGEAIKRTIRQQSLLK